MEKSIETFKGAVLAGICISIGCVVYLRVGGVAGAVLFAFGLLACVHFKLPLYTGTAGFVMNKVDLANLGLILFGNLTGCLLMAVAMAYSLAGSIPEAATAITAKRALLSPLATTLLATMCGFIMTVAVKFGREGRFLPLIFGVPVFILSGFIHSIADAFYILATPAPLLTAAVAVNYIFAVIGNFIGCNLYRLIHMRLPYPS